MLPRILEPEVMDSAEEALAYDSMDHSAVNHLFAADFLTHYDGPGPVLDVGAGTAQIPIELCRQHPGVRVIAADASAAMIARAEHNIAAAGFAKRIQPLLVDAKKLPQPDGSLPAIMSNSIVHHIPEPRTVFAEMARVAARGAVLFVRDLLRPENGATVDRLVATYAADCDALQRGLFDASLRAALTLDEVRDLVVDLGFDAETVKQTSDRHWTWIAAT